MKTRLLTLTLAAVLLSFGIYVFKYPPVQIKPSPTEICADYGNITISKLPISLLDEMSSNYQQKQLTYINNSLNISASSDARTIRFDLETMKIFINKIESLAISNGYTNIQDFGIRMYYASYPDVSAMRSNTNLSSLPNNYAELHTLFAVPTIKIGGIDTDFDPTELDTYTQFFRNIEPYAQNPSQLVPAYVVTQTSRVSSPGSNTSAQNHGNLYPPLGNQQLGF